MKSQMRDIVINTGPIIGMVAGAESLEWLPSLYNRILIPYEVYQEIKAGGLDNPEVFALSKIANRIEIGCKKADLSTDLTRELDLGEASVIHNAKINSVETVAIDEKAGRRLARIHGLKVTGSLGILLKAKKHGALHSIKNCIERMRMRGIWISPSLTEYALREANEL